MITVWFVPHAAGERKSVAWGSIRRVKNKVGIVKLGAYLVVFPPCERGKESARTVEIQ